MCGKSSSSKVDLVWHLRPICKWQHARMLILFLSCVNLTLTWFLQSDSMRSWKLVFFHLEPSEVYLQWVYLGEAAIWGGCESKERPWATGPARKRLVQVPHTYLQISKHGTKQESPFGPIYVSFMFFHEWGPNESWGAVRTVKIHIMPMCVCVCCCFHCVLQKMLLRPANIP